ncbi:MAG: tol-pal system protein YbgF [Desulfoferrobacter sp.]
MESKYHTRVVRFCLLILVATICWGCATPQETANLQQSINILFDRVQKLENKVQSMEGPEQKADLYARLDELQMKVGSLSGRIEEQQRQLNRLGAPTSSATPPSYGSAPVPSYSAAPSPTAEPTAAPKIVIQEEKNPEKAMYNNALQLYQQGKYLEARKEAKDFLAKYPKSDLADNALFLIGEAYYSEKSYKEAIESYQQLLDRYPKGNKVPSALLKQAGSFQKLGDATAARILYERLLESYPGTPQAQIAAKDLKQLP